MLGEPVAKRVLVAGATGRLGFIAELLLSHGHAVRAMTRDAGSAAAQRLRRVGAEVVAADFEDPASLEHAARDVDTVFATGTVHKAGPDGELRHGRNLADAALAAGARHLVYCSGDGAAADSPLQLFRVKHEVEAYIRALSLTHTILAPVYFMENLFNPWNLASLRGGIFPSPIPVEVPLQQVAIRDVLELAALAIERPSEFAGRRIRVASDELTASRAAESLSRMTGRRFIAEQVSVAELPPGLRALFAWLERPGHDVNLQSLHDAVPQVEWHSYDAWLESQRARLAALCPEEHTTPVGAD